jgi:hypothetical protein
MEVLFRTRGRIQELNLTLAEAGLREVLACRWRGQDPEMNKIKSSIVKRAKGVVASTRFVAGILCSSALCPV